LYIQLRTISGCSLWVVPVCTTRAWFAWLWFIVPEGKLPLLTRKTAKITARCCRALTLHARAAGVACALHLARHALYAALPAPLPLRWRHLRATKGVSKRKASARCRSGFRIGRSDLSGSSVLYLYGVYVLVDISTLRMCRLFSLYSIFWCMTHIAIGPSVDICVTHRTAHFTAHFGAPLHCITRLRYPATCLRLVPYLCAEEMWAGS
jgi:hypothetical protein